jgi:hypothetical protein
MEDLLKPRIVAIVFALGLLLGSILAVAQEVTNPPPQAVPYELLLNSTRAIPGAPQPAASNFGWKEAYYSNLYARGVESAGIFDYVGVVPGWWMLGSSTPNNDAGANPDTASTAAIGVDGSGRFGKVVLGFAGGATGDPAISHTPDMIWSAFSPGTPVAGALIAEWLPLNPVTIKHFLGTATTAPAGCTTNEVWQLWDATTSTQLASFTQSAQVSSQVVTVNAASLDFLQIKLLTAPAGCGTIPTGVNFTIQYYMQ